MAENDNGKRRFRRGDEQLLIALAAGCSIRQAARKVKRGEATVARRLEDPVFRDRLDAIRRDMLDRAIGRLSATLAAAATTLRKLLQAKSETVRLGAARAVLELHARVREAGEFEERLSAVEAMLKGEKA